MISGVWTVAADGPPIGDERSASDLIGEMYGSDADWLAIPTARLHPDFLRLSTRMAGLFLQKLVNYRIGVAIVGDISGWAEDSEALQAFVRESNRGRTVWFVGDLEDLKARLFPKGAEA